MSKDYSFLSKKLEAREREDSLRELRFDEGLVDFCSNDYLGFSKTGILQNKIDELSKSEMIDRVGSTGSRLISGNMHFSENLEEEIAEFHDAEAGLIYNSGYDANVGLFSSIPQRGDTVIYDELIHASIRDGIRLSLAKCFSFNHNDISSLEKRLSKTEGNVFVAVESVYSMDGDFSPLIEISELCEKHNANLIVDEAHATGIFGEYGQGIVHSLELQEKVFARVHTFGKALGAHGAIVLGSDVLRKYLINYSRSFIYTTALSLHSLVAIKSAYALLKESQENRDMLIKLIDFFVKVTENISGINLIKSQSSIQSIIIPGNTKVKELSAELKKIGLDIRPILHPTVEKGKERLRICLHSFNTFDEINEIVKIIS